MSAGLLAPKKRDHIFARRHLYLNYGLLTLATLLSDTGQNVKLVHGGFSNPESLADQLVCNGTIGEDTFLFLSLPSFFAVPWAQLFVRRAKSICPEIKTIVGGRWVVGSDGGWIRSKLPEIDLVVYGTAEERIVQLLDLSRWREIPGTDRSLASTSSEQWKGYVNLQYQLDDSFMSFCPSIEVSRGCGMGCSFCVENNIAVQKLRGPESIVGAMEAASELFQDTALNFYLEASWFVPSHSWAEVFVRRYHQAGLRNRWRCETRIDTLRPPTLAHLVRSGLKVLDLGFESGSPRQLQSMNKTRDPVRYLTAASEVLRHCKELGVWVKLNVMLYPGETEETVTETLEWMDKHRECIKGVSVSSMTVYGHGPDALRFLGELAFKGARPVDNASMEFNGYTFLHLSPEIDYYRAQALVNEIAQAFMADRDYYDLKSFSYFPRDYGYAQFCSDLARGATSDLPFRVEGAKSRSAMPSGNFNSSHR